MGLGKSVRKEKWGKREREKKREKKLFYWFGKMAKQLNLTQIFENILGTQKKVIFSRLFYLNSYENNTINKFYRTICYINVRFLQ